MLTVEGVVPGGPADGKLEPGDVLVREALTQALPCAALFFPRRPRGLLLMPLALLGLRVCITAPAGQAGQARLRPSS